MNIYLDIDGTLVDSNGVPAEGVHDFLEWITKKADCYWLTTHCRNENDIDHLQEYLRECFKPETVEILQVVKPTKWEMLKTEAINFNQRFRWFEDQPTHQELLKLKVERVSECLININLEDKPYLNYKELMSKIDAPIFRGL